MKMKKLTALALAGVLCLGMSTTAFAAASVGEKDAIKATEEGKEIIAVNTENPSFDGWKSSDPNVVNKSVRNTFMTRKNDLQTRLDEMLEDPDNYSANQIKEVQDELNAIEALTAKGAKFEIAYLADLDFEGEISADNKVNVRFDLNGRLKDLKLGETVNILHQGKNGVWEVYAATVKQDENGYYYTDWDFDHFSPVAVVRMTSAGAVIDPGEDPEDPGEDPEDPSEDPGNTTPDVPNLDNNAAADANANGTITADQLADLIVKKLQQNADAASKVVVRTSGKASPKTGE